MFYIVEITTMSDETNPIGIYGFEDYKLALMRFYQTLASGVANENVKSVNVIMMDAQGDIVKREIWAQ